MAEEAVVEETPTETPPPSTETPEAKQEAPPKQEAKQETIATSEPDETPVAVPATWPEDWRGRFAGSNEEELKKLNRYKTPENVWKAYKAMEQKLSSGEYMRARPDPADEEAMTEWRKEMGLPDTHEGYLEGMELDEIIQPVAEAYAEKMFAKGHSKEDVQAGVNAYLEERQKALEARVEADEENRRMVEDELRADWGPEYRGNLNTMHAMLEMYGDEEATEALFSARTADGTVLGDHPAVLRLIVGLAKELMPSGVVTPMGGSDPAKSLQAEKEELQRLMTNTREWAQREDLQKRYLEILEAEERASRRRA